MGLIRSCSRSSLVLLSLLVIGCSVIGGSLWDQRYGKPQAREYVPQHTSTGIDYHADVQQVFEQRCIVCHACYDAPCQLKLESFKGLLRGASTEKVYDGSRLLAANLTRLFEDATTTQEWRDKGFFPVLNERLNMTEANIEGSVMARMLMLKQQHPLPKTAILPESFTFDLNRDQQCPKLEQLERYEKKYPLWGMPYGLPGLEQDEYNLLMRWLAEGAQPGPAKKMDAQLEAVIADWESFLNGDDIKSQLVNRYLFEHLFLAHVYFDAAPQHYFRLVRSSTPPGEPIQRISTRRPFDDPNVERVYYRFWRDPSTIVAKNFLPYALNSARRSKWQTWFYETEYQVSKLPSYHPDTAANPFATFMELPVGSRYRFLLDEAQFTIMNFIKGPVCRGQVALNVIQDHFWVFFVDPKLMSSELDAMFLAQNSSHLQLPASVGSTLLPMTNWSRYSSLQKDYLVAKANYVQEKVERQGAVTLDMIWDGDGNNQNAALTVFRHSDSASVNQGLIGQNPKTAWVIGYPLLERIHYLLVAGFDVYGNLSHQLLSRLYMDFLRMEGEITFLDMLPPETRQAELAFWYRNAEKEVHEYLDLYQKNLHVKNAIPYKTDQHKAELFGMLKAHLQPVLDHQHDIVSTRLPKATQDALNKLHAVSGEPISFLPQTTFIRVPDVGVFTLLHNNAYTNLSSLFREEHRRVPAEDDITLVRGIIGAYPNAFMLVDKKQLPDFVARVQQLTSEADYQALRDRYGIRRTDPDFWKISDEIHAYYRVTQPDDAGILDYNRLENR
jgi:hypothetical protein